jgi:hypothetical protein
MLLERFNKTLILILIKLIKINKINKIRIKSEN